VKVPAAAIASCFLGGIVVGLSVSSSYHATSHATWHGSLRTLLLSGFLLAAVIAVAGISLTKLQATVWAGAACAAFWLVLGVLTAGIAQQPRPADHILSRVEAKQIDLHAPLRWQGYLRDDPTRLPWGYRYDVDLNAVEYQGESLPTQGGLRLSFTAQADQPMLLDLHAGDEVAALAQARLPQVYKNEGAFDRRRYLASQNIDLTATLRAPTLIEHIANHRTTAATMLASARRRLRDEVDTLFAANPSNAAVLRAMLLGDRSFVEHDTSLNFQKTGVFHVLVVAGLHVGALAIFVVWMARKLRLSPIWTILFTLVVLGAYVAVVEQRPPVLRAVLMAAIVVAGRFFYRRLDALNSACVAALILLLARPTLALDSSFQLTFIAIGSIAGLALPILERSVQPYARAMRGWRDVTRDAAHLPHAAQFRLDVRALARWISVRAPRPLGGASENIFASALGLSFRIWELLFVSFILQLAMLPLVARDFHRVTLAGPIVNIFAVPLTGAIVPLGFFTLALGIAFPILHRGLAAVLSVPTAALLQVVHWFASLPHLSYRIPTPSLALTTTFFAILGLLIATLRSPFTLWRRAIMTTLLGALGACSLLIALFPFAPTVSAGKLELSILDVGQGDSLFIVSPHGKTLLIDGGGAFGGFPGQQQHSGTDPGEEAVSAYLWSRGFQHLDVVTLTHAHQDHLGGLTAILQNFRVDTLWIGREVQSSGLAKLEELARARAVRIEHQNQGNTLNWDGVEMDFLWPASASDEAASAAKNSDSLVLQLRYGNRHFLLPGDAEKDAERAMLSQNSAGLLQSDVLKIGHHGSKNSTMPDFLDAVHPRLAIISAGEDNPYGHPSPVLLERLIGAGIPTLRTDRDGAVHILTDGDTLEVTCFATCDHAISPVLARAPDQHKPGEQQ
jgi:competence protein ComEC